MESLPKNSLIIYLWKREDYSVDDNFYFCNYLIAIIQRSLHLLGGV